MGYKKKKNLTNLIDQLPELIEGYEDNRYISNHIRETYIPSKEYTENYQQRQYQPQQYQLQQQQQQLQQQQQQKPPPQQQQQQPQPQQPQPQQPIIEKFVSDTPEAYTPLPPKFPSCLEVSEHISSCPICSKLYKNDNTLYIITIVILAVLCILLLKKVLNL